MCFGGPEIDTRYQDFSISEAERARAEEDARQARIAEGMKHIAAIYEGGAYAAPETMPEVVNAGAVPATPDTGGIPGFPGATTTSAPAGGTRNYANDQWTVTDFGPRGPETIFEGMQPILDQRRAAMEGYYRPQLDKEAERAKENLTFALARAGQLNSSTAGRRQGDLTEDMALEGGRLQSRIAQDIASTRTSAAGQRAAIEAALRSTGDASQAANQALQSAVTFRQDMPELSPLGQLFAGVAEGIGSVRQGYEAGRIRRLATPAPLTDGSGRTVI